jgi:FkbM family methyltransferase
VTPSPPSPPSRPSAVQWLALPDPSGGVPLRLCAPVDPPDRIAVDIAQGIWSPPAALRCVLDLLTPGATLLDLGAHLGTVSLCAARRGAKVVAVEASPRNARCLEMSVEANGLDVTVVPVVVAAARGRLHFHEDGPFGQVTEDPGAVEVEALTVKDILERAGTGLVDVVKIDVEGHELTVLDGMRDILTGPQSPVVVIEGNGFTLGAANLLPGDLLVRLHTYGLRTWRIGDGSLTPTRREELQPETVADYIASRAAPPWPEAPARTDDDIAAALAAEARHPVWTHRRYVAGALATAPDALTARPAVRAAIEQLLLDHDAEVRQATSWWLRRPESRTMRALAGSFRALARETESLSARVRRA